MSGEVLVVGLGEVGRPLAEVLGRSYRVHTRDLEPLSLHHVDVLHVCYPYGIDDFVETTAGYAEQYRPGLVIVNSTVVPGTTRALQEKTGLPTAYSPVRGKHVRMSEDLLRYAKFVASSSPDALALAEAHFSGAAMTVRTMGSPEALELAKLLETSYFGVLIAWAQEMERLANSLGVGYYEVQRFMEEIDFLPRTVFEPGFIGGHCVIPNSHLLDSVKPSLFMEAMRLSNEIKGQEWEQAGRSRHERITPREIGPE